ncbi:MAG: acyloxyacyl hydrolase [Thermodesulfobacteriota bacterium]
MARIFKKILRKRSFLSILISSSLIGCFALLCYGEDQGDVQWGFSVSGGPNVRSSPKFTHVALLPRVGWALHRKWNFELEGNLSYYGIRGEENLYLVGGNGNFRFSPVHLRKIIPFLLAGGGLAYTNNSGFVQEMGDSHTAGILQGGGGILYDQGKGFLVRVEYRFHHISDPFERDDGLNTHSFVLGFTF